MGEIIGGTVGFLLYFVYDINSIKWKNSFLQKFFAIGSVCVICSTVWALVENISEDIMHSVIGIILGAVSLGFLGLLVYTLFFALPFNETYLHESKERIAYTEGVYSLCRHPGVLWFAGAYLCFAGMSGTLRSSLYFILMIFWNFLYVVFQDFLIFPATFINYEKYKGNTPFIFPNRRSVNMFLLWKRDRKRS